MTENKSDTSFSLPAASRAVDGALAGLVRATMSVPGNLISEVDRFRMVREQTLNMLAGTSVAQAQWSPGREVWSMLQIADHLLQSEELYREQFRLLIQAAKEGRNSPIHIGFREVDTSIAGIPRHVIRMFETPARVMTSLVPRAVREMLIRYPIVPAMNPTATTPRPGLTVEKLRADLAASLAVTESLLRAPMPANLEKPAIVHPIMGSNNLRELLRIAIAHEERHQGQISDLRTNAAFPKS
jgi:uncharacterized damage-inducible protein DinB